MPVLISTVVFLLLLEGVCLVMRFPKGASRFIETTVLKSKLSTHKTKGETRIFTYGESTMHGAHYWPYSNPAVWLNEYLKDFLPGKNVRIINFARIGQNSSFIYESFRDTLAYKPDVAVFYLGHNDFLPGNRFDQKDGRRDTWSVRFKWLYRQSRLISAVTRYAISKKLDRKSADQVGYSKIETPAGGYGPENQVVRTSPVYKKGVNVFRENVHNIIKLARKNKIPVIFLKPASNLKDFPPTCSGHGTKLADGDLRNWESFFEEGKKAQERGDLSGALGFYENAASLDGDYAELSFRIAQIYFAQGDLEKAKKLFERARDNDCMIVRATPEILSLFDTVQTKNKAVVLDTDKILAPEAPGGILGFPVVEDNVHFSPQGHSRLGRVLAQEMADRDWLAAKSEWQFQKERSYEDLAKALGITPEVFFESYLLCVSYYGSKYDNRILFAKKALEIKPDDPRALRHLAWSYWLKGDSVNAAEVYKKLQQKHPEDFKEAIKDQPEIRKALQIPWES